MSCKTDADMDDWFWASSQLHASWAEALTNRVLLESMSVHLSKGTGLHTRLTFIHGGSPFRCKPLQPVLAQKSIPLADLCVLVRQVDREKGLFDCRFMLLKAHVDENTAPSEVEQDIFFYQGWPPFTLNTGILGVRKQSLKYELPVDGWAISAEMVARNFFLGFMKFKAVKYFKKDRSKEDLLMVVDPVGLSMPSHSFHTLLKRMTSRWNHGPMNVGLNILDRDVSDGWTGLIKKLWSTTGFQMYQNHEIRLAKPTLAWIDHLFTYQSRLVYQDDHFVSRQVAGFDASLFPRDLMDKADLFWDEGLPYNLPNKAAKTGMNWLVLDVHSP